MNKKIISILVSMLLCVTVSAVTGTEIVDENVIQSFEPAPSSVISGESHVGTEDIVYEGFRNGDWYTVDVQTDEAGSFPALDPASWTSLGTSGHCYAGTWANGEWYAIDDNTQNLGTIDTSTGAFNVIGNTGLSGSDITTGMAYDPSTDTMYLTSAVGGSQTHLYTVDLDTADVTDLGSLTPLIIAIGCSMEGTIYATSISPDSSYIIDPSGPTATEIGPLGIDLNWAQGAAFDKNNGKFYAAAYTASQVAQLYEINLTTGAADPLIGSFPSGEHCAFAIPYTANYPPDTPDTPTGPDEGVTGVEYEFSTSTTDPEEDQILYMFDWGDGTYSEWLGPYASGATGKGTHSWDSGGDFDIKVKAKDENDGESDWSPAHTITIIEGPMLEIGNIQGGLFKVSAPISNTGAMDATGVEWSITLKGGAWIGKETTGEDLTITAGGEETITSGLILGLGATTVTVTAEVPEGVSDARTQNGFILLFFVKVNPGG